MKSLLIGLAIALALSIAGNAWLTHAYIGERDTRVTAENERKQARDAANTCSASVKALRERAEKAEKEGAVARAAAAASAAKSEARADKILSTPDAVPGNDCQSARAVVDDWLGSRE